MPGQGGAYGGSLPATTAIGGSRDPARGFPPAPGAGIPAYPPGQFSAWNAAPDEGPATADALLAGSAAGAATSIGGNATDFADAGGWESPGSPTATWLGSAADAGTAGPAASGFASSYVGPDSTVAVADPADSPDWGYDSGADGATRTFTQAPAEADDGGWEYAGQALGPTPTRPGEASDSLDAALKAPPARGGRLARRRPKRPPRTRRKLLIAGIAALVVAALGGTAAYSLSGQGTPAPARSTPPRAASVPRPSPTPTLGKWEHIATRAQDPAPLTLAELYPPTLSATGQSYARAAEQLDTNCPQAVFGSALKAATHKGKCTQVARATYITGDQKLMGTIGVLNLVNFQAASMVGKVAGSNEFIGPLAAASGLTSKIAKGTGLVQAEIKGHYLILTWAEYTNLHGPASSHDQTLLVTFSNELIQLTANHSLTNRMVTGQPHT
jgi:hypothetical protein